MLGNIFITPNWLQKKNNPSVLASVSCTDLSALYVSGLGALYGPFNPHILLASVHYTVVNAFKGTINVKPLHPGQELEFKPLCHTRVKNVFHIYPTYLSSQLVLSNYNRYEHI
jgi:hypothetical protein